MATIIRYATVSRTTLQGTEEGDEQLDCLVTNRYNFN